MRSWTWRRPKGTRRCLLFLLLCAQCLSPAQRGFTAETPASEVAEERLFAVYLNGQDVHDTGLFLHREDGLLLARAEDLERWHLHVPSSAPFLHAEETYYALNEMTGLSYRIDESLQTVYIEARPEVFTRTILNESSASFAESPPAPLGGFLNYDISLQHSASRRQLGGLLEQGIFHDGGVGVNTLLAQDLSAHPTFIRLDTTWTIDKPSWLASLRFGDAISGGSGWVRSVRFGGVQWATNFAIHPEFISFPLPALSGEAVLPSTVDLYVNNILRLRRDVPAGPFTINHVPVVTGAGDISLVVRDLLGREQVITQAYYAGPRLLSRGLHEYSYEAGFIRKNYGLTSTDYGHFLAVGTHRLGITDQFTGEVHGEFLPTQQTLGFGGAVLSPTAGVWHAAVAGSHSDRGEGTLFTLGFERQSSRWSLGGRLQVASARFTQLGQQPRTTPPKLLSQLFLSLSLHPYGSLGVNYLQQENRSKPDVTVLNTNYNLSLGNLGFLNLFFSYPLQNGERPTFGIFFTRPLGERTSASLSTTVQRNNTQTVLQLQRNLPLGSGIGYRLLAGAGDTRRMEAGLSLQNDVGTYVIEAAHVQGQTSFRGNINGGLTLLGGKAFFTRRVTDSFALVQVPGYPNVRVYADNQLVARTDAAGNALIPHLRPYERNPIRIEQADLPLDAQIDTTQLNAIPSFRSGLLLPFPVRRSDGALLTVLLDDNMPLPAGAVVQIVGQRQPFPVALQGEVYITGLTAMNHLSASWRGQSCEFLVPFPETIEPLPHLGTFRCKGVRP